jgi:3D (Asp-Asp-Asp) domain-containing protein
VRRRKLWQNHAAAGALAMTLGATTVLTMTGVRFFESESDIRGQLHEHSLNTIEYNDEQIEAHRVEFRERTHAQPVPYETAYEYSNLIAIGDSVIAAQGVYGEMTFVFREMLIDGVVVTSEVLSREQTRDPETHVVIRGRALRTPNSRRDFPEIRLENGRPVDYVQRLSGNSTAYTAAPTARTATGRPLEIGIVAVDPRIIPYGSLLYIVTTCGRYVYGAAVAADTGGFIHWPNPTLVDVFLGYTTPETHRDALVWGNRAVDVYVINTGIY